MPTRTDGSGLSITLFFPPNDRPTDVYIDDRQLPTFVDGDHHQCFHLLGTIHLIMHLFRMLHNNDVFDVFCRGGRVLMGFCLRQFYVGMSGGEEIYLCVVRVRQVCFGSDVSDGIP